MDPEIGHEQAARIGRAGIAEKLTIVRVERVADRIAIPSRSPILEAQPESWGQVYRTPSVANANSHSSRRKVSCERENIRPRRGWS
jgi:hypothetical protein